MTAIFLLSHATEILQTGSRDFKVVNNGTCFVCDMEDS